ARRHPPLNRGGRQATDTLQSPVEPSRDLARFIHTRPLHTRAIRIPPIDFTMDSGKDRQKKDEGEKEFKVQPVKESVDPKFAPHHSHPGPAMAKEMPQHEGSKEDRQARKEALNK
ncbi:Uncharacterized protein TPAR_01025, partial [Tolypocladium paradoxum]